MDFSLCLLHDVRDFIVPEVVHASLLYLWADWDYFGKCVHLWHLNAPFRTQSVFLILQEVVFSRRTAVSFFPFILEKRSLGSLNCILNSIFDQIAIRHRKRLNFRGLHTSTLNYLRLQGGVLQILQIILDFIKRKHLMSFLQLNLLIGRHWIRLHIEQFVHDRGTRSVHARRHVNHNSIGNQGRWANLVCNVWEWRPGQRRLWKHMHDQIGDLIWKFILQTDSCLCHAVYIHLIFLVKLTGSFQHGQFQQNNSHGKDIWLNRN